jgi:hypothetical protein
MRAKKESKFPSPWREEVSKPDSVKLRYFRDSSLRQLSIEYAPEIENRNNAKDKTDRHFRDQRQNASSLRKEQGDVTQSPGLTPRSRASSRRRVEPRS